MRASASRPRSTDRADLWGLAFALVFPSTLTWSYFVALADAPTALQQAVYAAGKLVQFTFPLAFLGFVARRSLRLRQAWRPGLGEGILSGVAMLATILVVWRVLAHIESPLLSGLVPNVSAKVIGFGLTTPWRYLLLAAFYSLIHTFLEEYYWRWFVYARLRRRIGTVLATGLSSVGFMAHHVIVMGVFAGWTSPYTYLFSLAVAAGGAYWAWLFERSGTMVAPWVSHLFVDAAIFAVGYALLTGSGATS